MDGNSTVELNVKLIERVYMLDTFQSFQLNFGYGSKFDEQTWTFDLCEKCLEEFIHTFQIMPDIGYR